MAKNVSRTNELLLCQKNQKKYDARNIESILYYALMLQGLTFEDILRNNGLNEEEIDYLREKSMSNKGLLGILLEQAWFGYPANSKQGADFAETGVELKSTPFEGEGDAIRPGETLSLTQINYRQPQEPDFYKSHVWEKMQQILIVYYQRQKSLAEQRHSKLFYRIRYVFMLKPDEKDLAIIEADYKLLNSFMVRGDAHNLSRSHGLYLGVAPKSGKKEFVEQYYGDHIPALKRGYVLKISYLTFVLHRAAGIIDDVGGTVINDISELQGKTLSDILMERVHRFIGMEIHEIWDEVKRPDEGALPNAKNAEAVLTCRMLGVSNNRVEEFEKGGILPKVIRYRNKKSNNQQLRIEDINFMQLASEESDSSNNDMDDERHGWEASRLFSYLADRQYIFMVFWDNDEECVFKGCQLWGIPDSDLEIVHAAWAKTKLIINRGIKLEPRVDSKGNVSVNNNLPGIADNGVFHIRPHASHAYHVIDGVPYGNGSLSDTDLLPNGDRITRQAYWLNRKYIDSQLRDELVKKY